MLHDLSTGDSIHAGRPSIVKRSGFVDARIALNQVVKVADVPDEADDDDFLTFWMDSEGDRELAIASFLSKFDPEAVKAPAPKSNQRNK